MDKIKFKDFCKNVIEEVNLLIPAEKISLLRFLTVLKAEILLFLFLFIKLALEMK